jgi:DNA-binding CsgD family transcriptional regulator
MFEIGRAMFHQLFAGLLLIRGQLTGARTLIAEARDEMPALDHVLDVPEAALDTTLGDRDTARARLEGALDRARDNDLMVGTELLLSMLVEADVTDGDATGARARSRELDEVAAALGTPRALMHAAFARAVAHTDTGSALDCLRTAQRHGQHFEKAHLGLRLAWSGLVDPTTLHDVYDYFGRVDAPLARSWTRSAMETRGVPVPGRAVTKAENERLLGQLLTEGLTNRQIATVLDRSEKSVEGRLGRLFARTGYRSRIELAAALLDGTYPH